MSIEVRGIEVMMSQQDLDALLKPAEALPSGSIILEYGSGGSTSMFADALGYDRSLFSVEHHAEWFAKEGKRLEGHPNSDRITRILAPLDFHIGLRSAQARPQEPVHRRR